MTTYYCRSSGGSDANAGTSFALGWATIAKATATAIAGDTILICADGTHLPTATITFTTTGTSANRIKYRGASATGTDDGTVATISGASLGAGVHILTVASGKDFLTFDGLYLTGGTGDAVNSSGDNLRFSNCRLSNCVNGFTQVTFNKFTNFVNCEISSNSGYGYGGAFTSRGSASYRSCTIRNNGSYGTRMVAGTSMVQTLVFKNGAGGVLPDASASTGTIIQITSSTITGNTGAGIDVTAGTVASMIDITDTILSNNTTYGIKLNGANADQFRFYRMAAFGNTTAAIDAGSLPSDTVTTNPTYVSTTGGSENYTPTNTDLKITRTPLGGIGGSSYQWIGAIQPNVSSGSAEPSFAHVG